MRNHEQKILAKIELVAAGMLFSTAVGVLFLASMYAFLAFPQADDLFRASNPRSIIETVWGEYIGWTGRWAAMFIYFIIQHEDTIFRDYPFLLVGTWLVMIVACGIAISAFFERRPTEPAMMGGGVVLFTVLFLSVLGHENLFWLTGAVEYLLPIALGLILLSAGRSVASRWRLLLCCAMAFVIPGFHELMGGWIVAPLAVLLVGSFFLDRKNIKRRAMVFASGVAGAAVAFLAPGNFARLPHVRLEPLSLDASLGLAAEFLGRILLSYAYLLPLAALLMVVAASLKERPKWYSLAPHTLKVCLAISAIIMPFCMIIFILLITAHLPMRALVGIQIIGIISFLGLAAAVGFDAQGSASIRRMLGGRSGPIMRMVLIFLCVPTAASMPASSALVSEMDSAFENNETIWSRQSAIHELRDAGVRSVVLRDKLITMDIIPTYFDITEDEIDWRNKIYAFFYQLDCIRLAKNDEISDDTIQQGPPCLEGPPFPSLNEQRQK